MNNTIPGIGESPLYMNNTVPGIDESPLYMNNTVPGRLLHSGLRDLAELTPLAHAGFPLALLVKSNNNSISKKSWPIAYCNLLYKRVFWTCTILH